MNWIILLVLALLVLIGPSIWVKRTMLKYSAPDDRYPFNGHLFAEKLLKALHLNEVKVESTNLVDHYDPITKTVRLTEEKYQSQSLTAITVAAHEVGHAQQHETGYRPFKIRTLLV